jgi:hypothetical protein
VPRRRWCGISYAEGKQRNVIPTRSLRTNRHQQSAASLSHSRLTQRVMTRSVLLEQALGHDRETWCPMCGRKLCNRTEDAEVQLLLPYAVCRRTDKDDSLPLISQNQRILAGLSRSKSHIEGEVYDVRLAVRRSAPLPISARPGTDSKPCS